MSATEFPDSLENELLRSLRPVHPRSEFVDRLRNRLASPSNTILERTESPAASLALFLVGLALAVGLLLVWIVRQPR
jgi:hypothetical protein